jgi:NAD(P)-dependent dehydrogenase (short-subunit alcohol dehydrogenase family)
MRSIVMTGGSSGLGRVAAQQMAAAPDTRLLLGGRRDGPGGTETLPLDLARLESVGSFADLVEERLGRDWIGALVLNAGGGFPDGRTADGFETNFAVNYLGHYLLLRRLDSRLAEGAVVILTTSGTHDVAQRTVMPPPRHADARLLAYPELDPERDERPRTAAARAYSSAKLCNVLAARALDADPLSRARGLTVIAYDPGPTPGTGLARHSGFFVNLFWRVLGSPVRRLVPRFNSRAEAGRTLADLVLGRIRPPEGRIYAALRRGRLTWPDPSELARRDDLMTALWRDSAGLVGLAPESTGAAVRP